MKRFVKIIAVAVMLAATVAFTFGCNKAKAPSVETTQTSNVTTTSATIGGFVTSDGGSDVIERGICWDMNDNPDVSANLSIAGQGVGSFSCTLTDLQPATTYYARAYACNSVGVSYGAQVSFTTLSDGGGGGDDPSDPDNPGDPDNPSDPDDPEEPVLYTIEVSAYPADAGTVTGGGTFQEGETCTVSATANTDYLFANWTEDGSVVSSLQTYSFTVTGNRSLVADFTYNGSDNAPTGAINGKFTVNIYGDRVYFSQGNLQYIGSASSPYWKFADNQWDCLGTTTGQNSANSNVDRDYFGWGTSGYHDTNDTYNVYYQPWSTPVETVSTDYNYYGYGPSINMESSSLTGSSANYDWGVYNPISNGGNQAGLWRTLTGGRNGEWYYIFSIRAASTLNGVDNARFAKAKVANVQGVILFPDNYTHPSGVELPVNINETGAAGWSGNNYSQDDFALMQAAGVVFLPAAGYRIGTSVSCVGTEGSYWSATCRNSDESYRVYFNDIDLYSESWRVRYPGRSVRLVCPVE